MPRFLPKSCSLTLQKPCRRCKEDVNWDEVRKEIVKILEDDKYKELPDDTDCLKTSMRYHEIFESLLNYFESC